MKIYTKKLPYIQFLMKNFQNFPVPGRLNFAQKLHIFAKFFEFHKLNGPSIQLLNNQNINESFWKQKINSIKRNSLFLEEKYVQASISRKPYEVNLHLPVTGNENFFWSKIDT